MVDFEAIKSDWAARGFSCGVWTDPPGQVWADYTHGSDELVMLVRGELELHFQGRQHRAVVGEEFLIPAGVKHTVINPGKEQNAWLYGYATGH